MRIQHNITAMNSYRNFTNNNSKLGKNLEKLSSGYAINRAGDDAAGLAISEKMRAQITGIEGATKNSKDGISLIQTAEGALTEVHDMLNRMTTLAEQSANGTYQNELDREQLQKEVQSLKNEIDRIADSTNFNGLKLLDGSLAGGGNVNSSASVSSGSFGNIETTTISAVKSAQTITGLKAADDQKFGENIVDGDVFKMDIGLSDGTTVTATLTAKKNDDGTFDVISQSGEKVKNFANEAKLENKDLGDMFKAALKETKLFDDYVITNTNQDVTFTARSAGEGVTTITSVRESMVDKNGAAKSGVLGSNPAAATVSDPTGKDEITAVKNSAFTLFDGTNADQAVFSINGQKFAIGTAANAEKMSSDVNYIIASAVTDYTNIAAQLQQKTGLKVTGSATAIDASTPGYKFEANTTSTSTSSGRGLTLQIGDTSDSFNKLTVSIGDMHANSIGIGNVDISTQSGAALALDRIKTAINNVSDTRGTLGALQNRLDHTINNLGVMKENIQNAESTIRDTDVAEEMMTYTKNNILNQSAQAMLAQANQLPQGVLQLLQ